METKEFINELNRMMDSLRKSKGIEEKTESTCSGIPCEECPFNNDTGCVLTITNTNRFLTAIEIVEEWSKEHPKKTNKEIFLKAFPNAQLFEDGTPKSCAYLLGIVSDRDGCPSCSECWNSEYNGVDVERLRGEKE